jgi:hypothetical protein
MSSIAFHSDFFKIAAAQPGLPHVPEDSLERAILSSQQKDAAITRGFFAWLGRILTRPEGNPSDRMENAILACQRKDASVVRHALNGH